MRNPKFLCVHLWCRLMGSLPSSTYHSADGEQVRVYLRACSCCRTRSAFLAHDLNLDKSVLVLPPIWCKGYKDQRAVLNHRDPRTTLCLPRIIVSLDES
jgi:hypothetical protein